jgi:purine-cytosine permease-like protein
MCLSIAPFFIFGRFGKSSNWKNYATFTLVTGIIANIPGIILWVTLATTRLPEIEGLIQRLGIVFIFIWIEVIALKMHNLSRMASSPQ